MPDQPLILRDTPCKALQNREFTELTQRLSVALSDVAIQGRMVVSIAGILRSTVVRTCLAKLGPVFGQSRSCSCAIVDRNIRQLGRIRLSDPHLAVEGSGIAVRL